MNPYQTSRDYAQLLALMKAGHRIACLVDYRFQSDDPTEPSCRDIAHTRASPPEPKSQFEDTRNHWFLSIGARGICYIGGMHISDTDFLAQCAKYNVEFLVPAALPLH